MSNSSSGKAPIRDFDAFMRERITKYEPLERDDEPKDVARLGREQISGYFAKEKAAFADRSVDQERQSFEAFFARQNLHKERDTSANLADLKKNPAFSQRSANDLQQLAVLRTNITDGLDRKGVDPVARNAMLEKFDKVYAEPKALEKTNAAVDATLDFTKPAQTKASAHELTIGG